MTIVKTWESTTARWRLFQERQAVGGRLLPLLAVLAPAGPRPRVDISAPRLVPTRAAVVSVVIPCYNYGHFLPAAVESVLAQDGVETEVIIIDDCSTDDSRDVAARLAADHPRVRCEVNAANSGHVRSFNAGWALAKGQYVVKLDADDLLTPGALARAVAVFEEHPSVGLVYGHPRHFFTAEPPAARIDRPRWTVWRGGDWLAERCRLGTSAITNPEMVLRNSLLREHGPMDPTVAYAPDMEISLRLAALSDVGYVGGADQALHREHRASMSETDGSGTLVDLRARRLAFDRALTALPEVESGRMLRLANRALAADALRFASSAFDHRRPHTDVVELLSFARDVCPGSTEWPQYRRLARNGRRARVAALSRMAARRWRQATYYARWMVSGV